MDRLTTPWRFAYVSGKTKEDGCVFCNIPAGDDRDRLILHRGVHWYVVMNRYPYNGGHMLLVLNRHQPRLGACTPDELQEMGRLLSLMETALRECYHPDGINCGYNGGQSAGAGIPEHMHVHMLPRWAGDTNFMSTIAETRVMPQTLEQSWETLAPVLTRLAGETA